MGSIWTRLQHTTLQYPQFLSPKPWGDIPYLPNVRGRRHIFNPLGTQTMPYDPLLLVNCKQLDNAGKGWRSRLIPRPNAHDTLGLMRKISRPAGKHGELKRENNLITCLHKSSTFRENNIYFLTQVRKGRENHSFICFCSKMSTKVSSLTLTNLYRGRNTGKHFCRWKVLYCIL